MYVSVDEGLPHSELNSDNFSMRVKGDFWLHTSIHYNKVGLFQFVASDWISSIFTNIFEDKASLIKFSRFFRNNGFLWRFSRDSTGKKHQQSWSLWYKLAELVVTCLLVLFQSIPIMSEKQQRLVYSIIEFLNQSIQDGTVKADDQESLEVASAFVVCINDV